MDGTTRVTHNKRIESFTSLIRALKSGAFSRPHANVKDNCYISVKNLPYKKCR
jgi:hypothetical protein